MKIKDFEQKARDALLACFQDVPFVSAPENVTSLFESNQVDAVFRIINQRAERPIHLVVETKTNGQPRYTREAVNQLLVALDEFDENAYGVFIAPYISPTSADICKENNIGYVDLAGNCYLSFSTVFIRKEGNPNPYTEKNPLQSLFNPKSERILRVLLTAGPKEWKVAELAEEANVSLGLVSNVKTYLNDQEWLDAQTIGFRLTKPFELLEAWTENYSYQRNQVREYYSLQEVGEVEAQLLRVCQDLDLRCGLSGFSGGSRYATAVRYHRAMAYVEGEIDSVVSSLKLKRVDSGANVVLLTPYDEGVFYASQERDGDLVVSPIQTYLDLMSIPGRGEEAAQALFNQVIGKLW
ncbi:MAG: type IV toxin-antitoxin system AbiEi family antitoxin [Anaerolineales bacterium]